MDAVAPSLKPKPTPQEVCRLQEMFPRLDYLMCETLLMQTEEELEKYLNAPEKK